MGFVMRHVISRFSLSLIAACLGAAIMTSAAYAQAAKGASGLPLPRFVSLKPGVSVEIIQEYDNWRRIRDADGTEGWVNQALLSGDRTAVAAPWMRGKGEGVFVNMRRDAQGNSPIVARMEPGVIVKVGECNGDWCHAEAQGVEGWIAQGEIWGAYPGEAFK